MKWEGGVVVHQRCRRGCRRLFLVLCYRCGSMGEKLHDYTLNMVRAKLTPSQTCWSWRATLRDVRKREGTAGPQDVLLTPWPSLQTFYFSAISHWGRARCCRILHPLSPSAALNISLPGGHGHLGRQDWLPWGPCRDKGRCKSPRAAYFSLGIAKLGHSGSHSLCATWAPTVLLKCGVKADN